MNFIYNEESITRDFCNKCIELYEKYQLEYGHEGVTMTGVNKPIKDTRDLCITVNNKIIPNDLYELNENLFEKLSYVLPLYVKNQNLFFGSEVLNYKSMCDTGFMIQKYNKNKGRYVYHNDYRFDPSINKPRLLTFIWYLNDVYEGGETEFWHSFKIKPKQGNLVIFPSNWTFPHSGLMPVSDDKYIITGWLCASDTESNTDSERSLIQTKE